MAWCGVVDTYIYRGDRFTPLDQWIAWLDTWLSRGATFPDPLIEGYVACSMANALFYRQPLRGDVTDWFDRAWSIAQRDNDPNLLVQTAFSYVGWNIRMGAFDKSRIMLDTVRQAVDLDLMSPMLKILLKLHEAMSGWFDRKPEERLALLDEALELAKAADIHHQDANLHSVEAYYALATGDAEQAAVFLERMAAAVQVSPVQGRAQAIPSLNNSMIQSGVSPAQSGFDPWGFNPWGLADPCLLWAEANGFDPSVCYGSGGSGPTDPGPPSTPYPPGPGGNQTQCTLCTLRYTAALARCARYGPLTALSCMGVATWRYQNCTRQHCT